MNLKKGSSVFFGFISLKLVSEMLHLPWYRSLGINKYAKMFPFIKLQSFISTVYLLFKSIPIAIKFQSVKSTLLKFIYIF